MIDPLRLRILKVMTDALKEITIANGYRTDPEGRVYRGRVIFGDDDDLPLLSILEVPIPEEQIAAPENSSFSNGVWELMVQGFVPDDPENPTDPAHVFMADVKQRLAQERRRARDFDTDEGIFGMGRFVTGINIGAGVVRPPDEISATAYFWLTVTLDVVEDLFDPYEQ